MAIRPRPAGRYPVLTRLSRSVHNTLKKHDLNTQLRIYVKCTKLAYASKRHILLKIWRSYPYNMQAQIRACTGAISFRVQQKCSITQSSEFFYQWYIALGIKAKYAPSIINQISYNQLCNTQTHTHPCDTRTCPPVSCPSLAYQMVLDGSLDDYLIMKNMCLFTLVR